MADAQDVLGSAGVRLVLALPKAGRIPYPDAPWWPVFLSELVRHDSGRAAVRGAPGPPSEGRGRARVGSPGRAR